jgi:hypothetical protein
MAGSGQLRWLAGGLLVGALLAACGDDGGPATTEDTGGSEAPVAEDDTNEEGRAPTHRSRGADDRRLVTPV